MVHHLWEFYATNCPYSYVVTLKNCVSDAERTIKEMFNTAQISSIYYRKSVILPKLKELNDATNK